MTAKNTLHLSLQEGGPVLDPFSFAEEKFPQIGPGCDPAHLDDTRHHVPGDLPGDLIPHLLSTTIKIGFRLTVPGCDQPALRLDRTLPHDRVVETAFSSHDDEAIADAVRAWVTSTDWPPSSCVRYLAKRLKGDTPFSSRLRWVSIRAIERVWASELEMAALETVVLPNHLNVDVGDGVDNP